MLRPRRAGVAEEMLRLEVKLLNGADLLLELVRGHTCLCVHTARLTHTSPNKCTARSLEHLLQSGCVTGTR